MENVASWIGQSEENEKIWNQLFTENLVKWLGKWNVKLIHLILNTVKSRVETRVFITRMDF